MQMKLIAISIVCSKVDAHFNSTQKEEFKIEFGCIPQENWNLFENHDKIVRNVCIDSNYQTHTEPRRSNYFYPILFRFERTKILDVDGIKRTFTMNFCVIIAWEDPRVKADFGGIESFIDLPPITTDSRAKIWTPFFRVGHWSPYKKAICFRSDNCKDGNPKFWCIGKRTFVSRFFHPQWDSDHDWDRLDNYNEMRLDLFKFSFR